MDSLLSNSRVWRMFRFDDIRITEKATCAIGAPREGPETGTAKRRCGPDRFGHVGEFHVTVGPERNRADRSRGWDWEVEGDNRKQKG